MTTGSLFIVATPIGNLSDISPRTVNALQQADYVLAEDTRRILKILNHCGLSKKLFSYSEHSSTVKEDAVLAELLAGKSYALVSDAGTPAVSDPGARLVQKDITQAITVVPISGPSAVTTLMSVFGVPETFFHFWGFFPIKKKKQRQMVDYYSTIPGVHVFFESPFRILKTLEACFADRADFHMVIGREMTKQFETFYRGTPAQVLEQLKAGVVKGEFCVGVVRELSSVVRRPSSEKNSFVDDGIRNTDDD